MDSLTRIFARDAQTERAGIPCPLTLAKARVCVKNSHGHCCASANGPSDDPDFHLSAGALIGSARMPVRVGEMSAAEPLAAALTILLGGKVAGFIPARDSLTELFLGFCACCVHRILHGTRGGAAGKGGFSLRARPRRLSPCRFKQYTPVRRRAPSDYQEHRLQYEWKRANLSRLRPDIP